MGAGVFGQLLVYKCLKVIQVKVYGTHWPSLMLVQENQNRKFCCKTDVVD